MTINEILKVVDHSTVSSYSVNGTTHSYLVIKKMFGDAECTSMQITAVLKDLDKDQIVFNLLSEYDITEGELDIHLPNNSYYTSINLNFVVSEEVTVYDY